MQSGHILTVFAALMIIWIAIFVYFLKSDDGDGKQKDIAGYMAFGMLWPIFRKHFDRPLYKREISGWFVVLVLMSSAIIASSTGII